MSRPMDQITIAGRTIGAGRPTFVVAELSANHKQELPEAVELVKAAQRAGADAIKLQTYTPDTLTLDERSEHFMIKDSAWAGKTLYEVYAEAYTPWEWHADLKRIAEDFGMVFFSSPFDPTAVDLLESIDVPAYKIASFEIVDIPLIRLVAATGKPVIISTGMADLAEVDEAVTAATDAGAKEIALLKCTSSYPAQPEEMNLTAIPTLASRFGVPVGLSDHTTGTWAAVAAIALGACIIEKHITLSRTDGGPDAAFSLEPDEFTDLVASVRAVDAALGDGVVVPSEHEVGSREFRRSLFVVRDVRKGERFTDENVRSIRPANGLHPRFLSKVLGAQAARDLVRGTPLSWDDVGH